MDPCIFAYDASCAEALADCYNAAHSQVPHCRPVSPEAIHRALTEPVEAPPAPPYPQRLAHPRMPLTAGQCWLAASGGRIIGWCHVAIETAEGSQRSGAARSFWYARGERRAGQTLLEQAARWLRAQGLAAMQLGHYRQRYAYHSVEHACLSQRQDHVHALLGLCGWQRHEQSLVLDWLDMTPCPSVHPPVSVSIDTLSVTESSGDPALYMRLYEGDEQVGLCVCVPAHQARSEWVYVPWIAVAERLRGRGLGRWLMLRALDSARAAGYRHACLCCDPNNARAWLAYANLGFRLVDWTASWTLERLGDM